MEAIKIVSVSKSFGFGDSYIKVLSDVNMSVKQEEMEMCIRDRYIGAR